MKPRCLRSIITVVFALLLTVPLFPASAQTSVEFKPGDRVMVSYLANRPLTIYDKPRQGAVSLTNLPAGTIVTLTKGPVSENDHTWWHIRGDSGQGWVMTAVPVAGKSVPTFSLATVDLLTAAVTALTNGIKRAPSAVTYLNRGLIYYGQKNYSLALTDFSSAIKLDTKLAAAYNSRGLVYLAMRSYRAAIDDFSQATTLVSSEVVYLNNRGRAYLGQENYPLAALDFELASRLNPAYLTALNNFQHTSNLAYGFADTTPLLTQMTQQDPNN